MLSEGQNSDRADGIAKEKRYEWADPGDPGKLMWIDKNEIEIDHRYQREASNDKAIELASKFDWSYFGVIIVGERPSGKYFAAEGQHRLLAAKKRTDITKVPCLVFKSSGARDEAEVFIGTNVNRKPVPSLAKYKALLMCGDPTASAVKALVEGCKRRIGSDSGPGVVSCVALLMRLMKSSPDELTRMFSIASTMCGESESLPDLLIDALVYIECHLPDGVSLTDKPWKKTLEAMPLASALKAMRSAAAVYAKGGARVWANGLLVQINKYKRSKLALRTDE